MAQQPQPLVHFLCDLRGQLMLCNYPVSIYANLALGQCRHGVQWPFPQGHLNIGGEILIPHRGRKVFKMGTLYDLQCICNWHYRGVLCRSLFLPEKIRKIISCSKQSILRTS